MKKGLILPGVAVICGLAGAIMRYMERQTGFEEEAGLAIPGNVPAIALIVFSAVFFVCVLAFVLYTGKRGDAGGYDEAFYAPHGSYMAGMLISALILAAAGVIIVVQAVNAPEGISIARLLFGAFAVLSAGAVATMGRSNYRGDGKGRYSLVLLVPAFFSCYWVILAYENHAANPVLLEYVYELFAVICVLLALYFMAGFGFEKPKPKSVTFFSMLGIYFSIVTLMDRHPLSTTLIYLSMLVFLICSAAVLQGNRKRTKGEAKAVRS